MGTMIIAVSRPISVEMRGRLPVRVRTQTGLCRAAAAERWQMGTAEKMRRMRRAAYRDGPPYLFWKGDRKHLLIFPYTHQQIQQRLRMPALLRS